eukprot:TRINITY_DN1490_c0_g1_i2.p1 TRINITY_DN1490_c0_g1~~TRINITY_DN1490_c0_g1_i2.p1  ORF type:complete len:373 (-),score=77.49 TRINITY_DN1490_c0_g1_i2:471-1589(-)
MRKVTEKEKKERKRKEKETRRIEEEDMRKEEETRARMRRKEIEEEERRRMRVEERKKEMEAERLRMIERRIQREKQEEQRKIEAEAVARKKKADREKLRVFKERKFWPFVDNCSTLKELFLEGVEKYEEKRADYLNYNKNAADVVLRLEARLVPVLIAAAQKCRDIPGTKKFSVKASGDVSVRGDDHALLKMLDVIDEILEANQQVVFRQFSSFLFAFTKEDKENLERHSECKISVVKVSNLDKGKTTNPVYTQSEKPVSSYGYDFRSQGYSRGFEYGPISKGLRVNTVKPPTIGGGARKAPVKGEEKVIVAVGCGKGLKKVQEGLEKLFSGVALGAKSVVTSGYRTQIQYWFLPYLPTWTLMNSIFKIFNS